MRRIMKTISKIFRLSVFTLCLAACSESPTCWDNTVKKGLADLLEEQYGWSEIQLSEIREIDSQLDARTCMAEVEYKSRFHNMGGVGMFFSQAVYGRKFTRGIERVEYKIKVQKTEQYGKQVFIEISGVGDEADNEFNRFFNQLAQ